MSASTPKAKTSQEEGPEGRAKGATGPYQRKAAKHGPLHVACLVYLNRSPSWIHKHQNKAKQLGSPLLDLICCSHQSRSQPPCKRRAREVMSSKSLQWKTTKSGFSGVGASSRHPTSDRSKQGSWE